MEHVVLCHPQSLGLELQSNRPAFCALPGTEDSRRPGSHHKNSSEERLFSAGPRSLALSMDNYPSLQNHRSSVQVTLSMNLHSYAMADHPTCAFNYEDLRDSRLMYNQPSLEVLPLRKQFQNSFIIAANPQQLRDHSCRPLSGTFSLCNVYSAHSFGEGEAKHADPRDIRDQQ